MTTNKVKKEDYKKYLEAGGVSQIEGVDKDTIGKMPEAELNKKLEGLTMVDLAQQAESAYGASINVQKVEVTNWNHMAAVLGSSAIGQAMGVKKDLPTNVPKSK